MTARARLGALAVLLALVACTADPTPSPRAACPTEPPTSTSAQATLQDAATATVTVSGAVTGSFTFELFGDEAPIATANFVSLSRCGFYDGIWFHRVLAGFVIQAGDPQTKAQEGDFAGLGTGGAGYEYEIEPPAPGLDYEPYTVAVANDERTNDSQFFVTLADLSGRLSLDYTIFGRVTDGTDVVDAIAAVPVNDPRIGIPLDLVTIDSITISGAAEPSPSG
jgi:cyclophilin family peptidyl-prolyl cis-trans isomerase